MCNGKWQPCLITSRPLAQDSKRVRTRKYIVGKRKVMSDLRLDLKVTAVARSGEMQTSYDGIDVSGDEGDLFADGDKVTPPRLYRGRYIAVTVPLHCL